MKPSSAIRIGVAVFVRPALWPTAVRQAIRLATPGWWHRSPFLPLPSKSYAEMRSTIQYGGQGDRFDAADVLKYLAWCKAEEVRS